MERCLKLTSQASPEVHYLLRYSILHFPPKKIKKNIKKKKHAKKHAKHGGDGVRGRIVGGEPAPLDAYPWFVGLSFGNFPFCGATLVSREYALTAAHWLFGRGLEATARVGAYAAPFGDGRDDPAQNGGQAVQSLPVVGIAMHPSYDYFSDSMDFDFGLIKLVAPATAAPVPIDGRDGRDVVAGYGPGKTGLFAAGFGETEDSFFGSDNLLQVDLNFAPQDVCQEALDDAFDEDAFDDDYFFFDDDYFDDDAFNVEVPRLSDSMMCAADVGQDTCYGDSGGPLYDQDEAQVGLTSWGSYNCTGVGVYSRISAAVSVVFLCHMQYARRGGGRGRVHGGRGGGRSRVLGGRVRAQGRVHLWTRP